MDPILLQEIHSDLREVKQHVLELVKQGAIANVTLIEHERRSTNLEARVLPLEKDYSFRSKLYAVMLGVGGLVVAAYKAFK